MDSKIKTLIAIAVIVVVGIVGYTKISSSLGKDPKITGLQAKFVGEVAPGETLRKSMFEVKGVTSSGKLVSLNDFSSESSKAAENGASCEVEIESQGYTATVIVDITRTVEFEKDIGYPNESDAKVTCYSNGDLEFTGSGAVTNFAKDMPWEDYEYTHVYFDETLEIESMDSWFYGNDKLVYCGSLPKTVKTLKHTFAGCTLLAQTPAFFQCTNLKVMDYAFSGCTSLKEIDVIPVNVTSMKYTFEDCSQLQYPVNLSKTSNLTNIDGLHKGCSNLREAAEIPQGVISMNECYQNCINIKAAVAFPANVQEISAAYSGDSAMETGASIPESVTDFSNCYSGCSALCGSLEINTDSNKFSGVLKEANTNGDKLSISGNSGNLLEIQKDANNPNIVLANAEAAAQQNERMLREEENKNG